MSGSLFFSLPLCPSVPVLIPVFSFFSSLYCCLSLSSLLSVCWRFFCPSFLCLALCSLPLAPPVSCCVLLVLLHVDFPTFLLLCPSVLLHGGIFFLFSISVLLPVAVFSFSASFLLPTLAFLLLSFFPLPCTSAFLYPCTPLPQSRSITLSCSPSLSLPFCLPDVCVSLRSPLFVSVSQSFCLHPSVILLLLLFLLFFFLPVSCGTSLFFRPPSLCPTPCPCHFDLCSASHLCLFSLSLSFSLYLFVSAPQSFSLILFFCFCHPSLFLCDPVCSSTSQFVVVLRVSLLCVSLLLSCSLPYYLLLHPLILLSAPVFSHAPPLCRSLCCSHLLSVPASCSLSFSISKYLSFWCPVPHLFSLSFCPSSCLFLVPLACYPSLIFTFSISLPPSGHSAPSLSVTNVSFSISAPLPVIIFSLP
ncbi:uncharacterized protein LOC142361679 isoform X1 [Opisthocomus hoazin]|uniref:uncharacterized protein LOC142361679 isoform X1 n=1 Tax=Opisthocomus hoazin TaxID=30419 RepID=UPI003F52B5F9